MGDLLLSTDHAQNEERIKQPYPSTATGASSAGSATRARAMTPDTIPQETESHGTRKSMHVTPEFVEGEEQAREDLAQVSTCSPVGETRMPKDLRQLRTKHRKLQRIRASYEEQRDRLRQEQDQMYAVDVQFLRKLQKVDLIALEDLRDFIADIIGHSEILQQARSAVATEQVKYEALETALVNKERELRDLESLAYRRTTTGSVGTLEQEEGLDAVGEVPTGSVANSQNAWRYQSFEGRRYLSQKGDVEILKEQLMDLRIYESEVTAEQADRRDAGLGPDDNLTAFLKGFDQQHDALVLRLRDAEETLARYKLELRIPEDSYFAPEGVSPAVSVFGQDSDADDNLNSANKSGEDRLTATAKAFLLPMSDSNSVYRLLEHESGGTVHKALSVNSWLLHRLRTSTSELGMLLAEHRKEGLQLEPDDFTRQVLANWLQDGTIQVLGLPSDAIDSHGYSMATVSGTPLNSKPTSENLLQISQQNVYSLQRRLNTRQAQTER
jgi:hypothetical protein